MRVSEFCGLMKKSGFWKQNNMRGSSILYKKDGSKMTYITSVYKGQHAPNRALIRYNKLNPDRQIEYITPHTFRHTFCTNLMEKGIDIKYLQYLMGHSEASTTLDVYSHINYEHVFKQMKKVMNSGENVMSTTP